MKKLLTIIILVIAANAVNAQNKPNRWAFTLPIDSASQKVDFQEVIRVNGSTKDELYTRAHDWLVKNFSYAGATTQLDDKAAGKMIVKGTYAGSYLTFLKPTSYTLSYTLYITVKESRYRYEITDFSVQDNPNDYNKNPVKLPLDPIALDPKNRNNKGEYKGDQKNYLESANIQGMALSQSLKAAMIYQAPVVIKNKDDF